MSGGKSVGFKQSADLFKDDRWGLVGWISKVGFLGLGSSNFNEFADLERDMYLQIYLNYTNVQWILCVLKLFFNVGLLNYLVITTSSENRGMKTGAIDVTLANRWQQNEGNLLAISGKSAG